MNECLICSKKRFIYKPYYDKKIKENILLTKETKIQICMSCGFGRATFLPNKKRLDFYFSSGQFLVEYQPNDELFRSLPNSRALSQYDSLATHFDFKQINSLLDFGARSATTSRTIKIRHPHINIIVVELSKQLNILLRDCNEIDQVHEDISFVSSYQDLIISSYVMEYILDPIFIMGEFKRLLNKGGYLLLEEANCPLSSFYNLMKTYEPRVNFFTEDALIQMAKKCNFELIWISGIGISLEDLYKNNMFLRKTIKQVGLISFPNKQGIGVRAILRKR